MMLHCTNQILLVFIDIYPENEYIYIYMCISMYVYIVQYCIKYGRILTIIIFSL